VAGAYLFHGPPGTGKEGFAIKFAALVNCREPEDEPCGTCLSCVKFRKLQHPNLTLVIPLPRDRDISKKDPPEKALSDKTLTRLGELLARKSSVLYSKIDLPRANTILLNSIRELRRRVYLKAAEQGRKVILVFDAHDLMTQQGESGNALLKILEEPPDNTTFVLTTEYPDRLAETIRSRCQSIYFPPVPEKRVVQYLVERMGKEEAEGRLIANLSQGNVRMATSLAEENLEEVDVLLKTMVGWITSNSESGWESFVNHGISVFRADPQELSPHLKLLSTRFRDAMYLQRLDGEAMVILSRVEGDVRKFAEQFPGADFAAIISDIETCGDSLSRNYNISLVFINLLLNIKENLMEG
ncbi:MAG: ATP-binding protein, partial [Fidelibacterota bacterium]